MNPHDHLIYNPITGLFYWKKTGKIAGCLEKDGYVQIRHNGKSIRAHRLAWFMTHGIWVRVVDHINGHRDDNRLSNLRESDYWTNSTKHTNRSGVRGVYASGLKWRAQYSFNGSKFYLGEFATKEDAAKALSTHQSTTIHNTKPHPRMGD